MKSIFHYNCYKRYINEFVESQPHNGHGMFRKLADALKISSTLISKIFKGEQHLNTDQCIALAEFLRLNSTESEYLMLLLLIERSGTQKAKKVFEKKLKTLKKVELDVKKQIIHTEQISEVQKVQYHSSWIYAAVRAVVNIEGKKTVKDIAQFLKVSEEKIKQAIDFLHEIGLIDKNEMKLTNMSIHLEKKSELASLRLQTWRLKSLQHLQDYPVIKDDEMFFNSIFTIEEKDVEVINQILKEAVMEIQKKVLNSKNVNKLCCLNLDFFQI